MSATVTDDLFLIKGLGLSPHTIQNPLTCDNEKWSGEKMILIPSLIHEELNRAEVVKKFSKRIPKRGFGTVVLGSSFNSTKDWEKYGAKILSKDKIDEEIQILKNGKFDDVIVIINRYDGIDLPDDTCRILIFDSKPYSESLVDMYFESCRSNSKINAIKTARTIEQGMGRSVRGEKDYSVILRNRAKIT